jgi:chromosome segregation ATPase
MRRRIALALLAVTLALPAAAVEKKADPAKEQLRRMQLTQRKMEQEKAQLTQEKTELDGKLKEVEGKLDETRSQAARKTARLEKELAAVQADKEALTTRLSATEQRLAKLTELQLSTDAERKRLDVLSTQLKQSLTACEAKNETLHQQGVELLERYERKNCVDAMLQSEPFTGLKRVEMENFVEDHREKLDEHKLDRSASR